MDLSSIVRAISSLKTKVDYLYHSYKIGKVVGGIQRVTDLSEAYSKLKNGETGIFQINYDVYQIGKSLDGYGFNSILYTD